MIGFGRLQAQISKLAKAPGRVARAVADEVGIEHAMQLVRRTRRDTGRARASTLVSTEPGDERGLPKGRYPEPTRAYFDDPRRRQIFGRRYVTQVARVDGTKSEDDLDYAGLWLDFDKAKPPAAAAARAQAPRIALKVLKEAIRDALR